MYRCSNVQPTIWQVRGACTIVVVSIVTVIEENILDISICALLEVVVCILRELARIGQIVNEVARFVGRRDVPADPECAKHSP